jgi:pimeloyl-ACP methyl ester carboxylesterase
VIDERSSRSEVLVEGVRTSLLVAGRPGDTSAVVFLHGSSGTAQDWIDLIRPVSTFARCIAPDMPGYGASDKPADFDYTVKGYGRHLSGVLDALRVQQVHLVGHDLGGPWGLQWAAAYPARLATLTLIGIGVLPGYRWHRFARLYRVPGIGELVLRLGTRRSVAQALQRGSGHPVPDRFVESVVRAFQDPDTRRAVLAFYRRTDDLGQLTVDAATALGSSDVPTLVIWGAGDPYVPVRFAEMQRRYFPGASILVLPESGHWPQVDDHDAVADAIMPFLRAHVGDGASHAEPSKGDPEPTRT